jgi:TRAP-type C4-dicarboxylate transport system permease small subunit
MRSALGRLARGGGALGQIVLVFMVVTICYDVVMRYLFLAPTHWSLEVNTFLIIFLALIPAADALAQDAHLRITFLADRLPPQARRAIHLVTCLLGAGFAAIMVWKGGLMSLQAFQYGERMSTSLGTPMVIPYLFIPVGFGLLGLQFLAQLRGPVDGEPKPHDLHQEL